MRTHKYLLIVSLFLALGLSAQVPPAQTARLNRKAEAAEALQAQHLPSISVAVFEAGKPLDAFALGFSDMEVHTEATPESLYRIASISKPITTVAVIELAREGKLPLDASAQQYCKAFDHHPEVTARELLSHHSGVHHYKSTQAENNTVHYATLNDAVKSFAADPLEFPAGKGFQYSSYAFTVLGCEIEGATGERYADFVREHVLLPAQMPHTIVDDAHRKIAGRVEFYSLRDSTLVRAAALDTSDRLPGGGWLSTPTDMARFASSVLSLLGEDWTRQMWTETTVAGEPMRYGLGWGLTRIEGHPVAEHSGGQAGTTTALVYVPDADLAVAVFTNRDGADMMALAHKFVAEILASQTVTSNSSRR
jgi:CubicO group peptidase (beta-lactamase class C family)